MTGKKRGPKAPLFLNRSYRSGRSDTDIMHSEGFIYVDKACVVQLDGVKRLAGRRGSDETLIRAGSKAQQIQIQQAAANGGTVHFHAIVEETNGGEITQQLQIEQL